MRNAPGMEKRSNINNFNLLIAGEIYFWHNWTVRLRSAMENNACSFLPIVGGHCGSDTKDRTRLAEMVPLLSCNRDISRHKSLFSITGIENEGELLLARASIFAQQRNVETWFICPQHRASLGASWKRSSFKCSISGSLSKQNATDVC